MTGTRKIIFFILVLSIFLTSGVGKVRAQTPTPTPFACCVPASPWTNPVLTSAWGVAADMARNRIYAADPNAGTILAFNYDGSPVTAFGGGAVSFSSAFGLAVRRCAMDGVYVCQRVGASSAVRKIDSNGNTVWTTSPPIGDTLRSLCVDDWGNSYVVGDSSQIYVLDPAGTPVQIITGSGPLGALNIPTGVFMLGLDLYVADTLNNRIVHFVESGVNTYSYAPSEAVTLSVAPYGITMDLAGHFYICSQALGIFAAFDGNFNPLTDWCTQPSMGGASEIAIDQSGSVYVAGIASSTVGKARTCFSQPLFTGCPPPYQGSDPPAQGNCFIYPSPARGSVASFSYRMAESGKVEIKVWNEKAERVAALVDQKPAGVQVSAFSISGFASGVYFYSAVLTYDSGRVEKIAPHKFAVIH